MSEIRTAREATAEERRSIIEIRQAGTIAAIETLDAMRNKFTPEFIAEAVAKLPADAQARFAAEFAPRPVRRILNVKTRAKKKP